MRNIQTTELNLVSGASIQFPLWHEGQGGQPVVIADWLPVGPEALEKPIIDTLGP